MSTPYVKRAMNAASVASLIQETQILRAGAQPGVVEIVGHRFGETSAELHLSFVDGKPLSLLAPSLETFVGTMTSVTATEAYLHQRRIAHQALTPEHILIPEAGGRPILCGFGSATVFDEDDVKTPNDDVAALGRLIAAATRSASIDLRQRANAIPTKRNDPAYVKLRQLAAAMTAQDESKRPSAEEACIALQAMASTNQPFTPPPVRHTPNLTTIRRVGAVIGAAVAIATFAVGVTQIHLGKNDRAAATAAPASPTVVLEPAAVLVDGERYEVGSAADTKLVGAWACTESKTLALFEAPTGRVFVYDKWPNLGKSLVPRLVATVKDGSSMTLGTDDVGCAVLQVSTPNGQRIVDPKVIAQ